MEKSVLFQNYECVYFCPIHQFILIFQDELNESSDFNSDTPLSAATKKLNCCKVKAKKRTEVNNNKNFIFDQPEEETVPTSPITSTPKRTAIQEPGTNIAKEPTLSTPTGPPGGRGEQASSSNTTSTPKRTRHNINAEGSEEASTCRLAHVLARSSFKDFVSTNLLL